MAKNKNFKNFEPEEVQIKRAIINGATFTDIEKWKSVKRSKVVNINGRITLEDRKALAGDGYADCICKEAQDTIEQMLNTGKSSKAVSNQTGVPLKIVLSISERISQKKIESVVKSLADADEENETMIENIDGDTSIVEKVTHELTKREKNKLAKLEQAELLYAEAAKGKTHEQIAEEYGMKLSQVKSLIRLLRSERGVPAIASMHTTHAKTRSDLGKTKNNSLSREQVMEISDYIMRGFSNTEIAPKFGITSTSVSKIRCKYTYREWTSGFDFPKESRDGRKTFNRKTLSKQDFEKVVQMLLNGNTNKEIANEVGASVTSISMIRNHQTYKNMTKDLVFPEPIDSMFAVTRNINDDANENASEITEPATEIEGAPTTTEIEESTETEVITAPPTIIGKAEYYCNIAKAFAADKVAALLVKGGIVLTYAVESTAVKALLRVIAMSTQDEITSSDIYVAGDDVDKVYAVNMCECLSVNSIIIAK